MSFEDDEYWEDEYSEYSFMPQHAVVQEKHYERRTAPDPVIPTRRRAGDPPEPKAPRRRGAFDAQRPSWLDDPDFVPIDTSVDNLAGDDFDDIDFNRPELGVDFDKPDFPIIDPAARPDLRRGAPSGPPRRALRPLRPAAPAGRRGPPRRPPGRRPARRRPRAPLHRIPPRRTLGRGRPLRRPPRQHRPPARGSHAATDDWDRRPPRAAERAHHRTPLGRVLESRRPAATAGPPTRTAAGPATHGADRPTPATTAATPASRPTGTPYAPARGDDERDYRGRGPDREDDDFRPIRPPGGRRPRREEADPRRPVRREGSGGVRARSGARRSV